MNNSNLNVTLEDRKKIEKGIAKGLKSVVVKTNWYSSAVPGYIHQTVKLFLSQVVYVVMGPDENKPTSSLKGHTF